MAAAPLHFRGARTAGRARPGRRYPFGIEPMNPDGSKFGAVKDVIRERAVVDEQCPKCDNKGLNFYTMQLRSVDEGQTVFYECPKCAHTFSQNN